jgi:hypothetical protein
MTASNQTSESAARGSTGKQDLTPERLRGLLASATFLPRLPAAIRTSTSEPVTAKGIQSAHQKDGGRAGHATADPRLPGH